MLFVIRLAMQLQRLQESILIAVRAQKFGYQGAEKLTQNRSTMARDSGCSLQPQYLEGGRTT